MWLWVFLVLGLGYVAYRMSLSIRAARASADGDHDRAGELRQRGVVLMLGTTAALLLVGLVLVVSMLVRG